MPEAGIPCASIVTYIVSAQHADDLAAAVKLDEKSAVEVLWVGVSPCLFESRIHHMKDLVIS